MCKDILRHMWPDGCGSVGWASSCRAKGHQFASQSGHMPALRVQSPYWAHARGSPQTGNMQVWQCKVLTRMWSNGNSHVWLARIGNFSTSQKPFWEFLIRWNMHLTFEPLIPFLSTYPWELVAHGCWKTCTWISILVPAKQIQHIHTMKYHSAVKPIKLLIHAAT